MFLAVFMAGCADGYSDAHYRPLLPVMPHHWHEILGKPHWHLEWVTDEGVWQQREVLPDSEPPNISLPGEWTTPVLAWPFWPERNIRPGTMRPSGALFPWDASGDKLVLSWMGGVDALFWKELALAERSTAAGDERLPWYFDWPRFRELLESESISETVREDPWLADWRNISRRTVQSGFDRRRIVEQDYTELSISGLDGYWIGSSPFADPLDVEEGYPLLLNATDIVDARVSSGAVIKYSKDGWVVIYEDSDL